VVDAVTDTAATTVGAVADAADTSVGAITEAASGAAGSISEAARGSVVASAGSLTDAVTGGTPTGEADHDTGSATAGSSGPAGGSSTYAFASSDSNRGASPLRSGRERTALTLADGAEAPRWAVHATDPCPGAGAPSCSPASGSTEEDSLAEKIAEVIGLLALTGFALLPWIAVMLALIILGSVALERARGMTLVGSQVRGGEGI
jgi:hypothetical protein